MTYDETVSRAEAIIAQLEQAEALSMDEYRTHAKEASRLLDECDKMLRGMDYSSEKSSSTER